MNQKRVFIDIETTGLDPFKDEIIQIAAIAIDHDGNELESLEMKVQFEPTVEMNDALCINSYDAEAWKTDALPASFAAQKLEKLLRDHATVEMISKRGKPYRVAQLVAYNGIRFDGPFLREWVRPWVSFFPASFHVLDPMQLAMWHRWVSPPKNWKQDTVAEHLGITIEGESHDALTDVRTMVEIVRMLERA